MWLNVVTQTIRQVTIRVTNVIRVCRFFYYFQNRMQGWLPNKFNFNNQPRNFAFKITNQDRLMMIMKRPPLERFSPSLVHTKHVYYKWVYSYCFLLWFHCEWAQCVKRRYKFRSPFIFGDAHFTALHQLAEMNLRMTKTAQLLGLGMGPNIVKGFWFFDGCFEEKMFGILFICTQRASKGWSMIPVQQRSKSYATFYSTHLLQWLKTLNT